jgi:hypothetical protein
VNEFEREPIPGLPEMLPDGERILWQGAPRWRSLARRAFHVRKVALYFALILAWLAVMDFSSGASLAHAALGGGWVLVLAHVSMGLLLLLAWAMSRATLYTITNRRVVMRFGVAIPMTINIPFRQISSAALRNHPDGTGDIPLSLTGKGRVSYLVLWPNVRPWRFGQVQPMLRCVEDAERVAHILSDAVAGAGLATTSNHQAEAGREAGPTSVTPAVQSA